MQVPYSVRGHSYSVHGRTHKEKVILTITGIMGFEVAWCIIYLSGCEYTYTTTALNIVWLQELTLCTKVDELCKWLYCVQLATRFLWGSSSCIHVCTKYTWMPYHFSLLQEKENTLYSPNAMAVYNHWTGLVDWTQWTGLVDWHFCIKNHFYALKTDLLASIVAWCATRTQKHSLLPAPDSFDLVVYNGP